MQKKQNVLIFKQKLRKFRQICNLQNASTKSFQQRQA